MPSSGSFLMISGHDFRSPRKANVHFIAEELAKLGKTRFFSIGFSYLSRIKKGPRVSLWGRANRPEHYQGVDTYLWRTLLHPFNLRLPFLRCIEKFWFNDYVADAPNTLREWIADAGTIILESGMSVIFYDLIKEINPTARVIYLCSDDLDTIGCSSHLQDQLQRITAQLDGIRVPSRVLASAFSSNAYVFFVPHGIDRSINDLGKTSPYAGGVNLVAVGSMLFDPHFFTIAAAAFPDYTFHVIGGGAKAALLRAPNIRVYGEMPFTETIAYIRHADVGIAPYEGKHVSNYLADTSMKLMQFGYLGLPAVCPHAAVGDYTGRFGYTPDDADSIVAAIRSALACGHFQASPALSWAEVTQRILAPTTFADTHL
jgi:2-beta-glucuronyltransferase